MTIDKGLNYDEEKYMDFGYRGTLFSDSELAGTCSARIVPLNKCPDEHYLWVAIDDLFVFPKFSGNGCQSKSERTLVEKIIEYANDNSLGVLKNCRSNHPTAESLRMNQLLLEMGFQRHDDKYLYYTFDGGAA